MIEIIKDETEIFEVANGVIGLKFYKRGEIQGKFEINFEKNKSAHCLVKDYFSAINFYGQNTLLKYFHHNFLKK